MLFDTGAGFRISLQPVSRHRRGFARFGGLEAYCIRSIWSCIMTFDNPRLAAMRDLLMFSANPDGGWGEDLRSYVDGRWVGRGASTASQTAWALLALLSAGERDSEAAQRGVAWLAETQTPEGTWEEPWYTGTGFPGDFYINYHLYRLTFPISALGRYLGGTT